MHASLDWTEISDDVIADACLMWTDYIITVLSFLIACIMGHPTADKYATAPIFNVSTEAENREGC